MALCDVAAYGPLLSGIALSAAAVAAWTTLLSYNRRTFEAVWLDSLRRLHAEFWNDSEMAKIRKCLSSDDEYTNVEEVLIRRLAVSENNLSSMDNDVLENIDRFCALMARIGYFGQRSRTWDQRQHYRFTLAHWLLKINARHSLLEYVKRFWPPLYEVVKQEQKNSTRLWFRSQT